MDEALARLLTNLIIDAGIVVGEFKTAVDKFIEHQQTPSCPDCGSALNRYARAVDGERVTVARCDFCGWQNQFRVAEVEAIQPEEKATTSINLKEGLVKKGGVNKPPTTPRPSPPKGQG